MQMKKKVFVGLSGGVDSSVATLLLKNKGYDVTGVFIKAWHPNFLPCNWRSEMHDAMRICARLDIPFLLCDLEKEYKSEIVDYLIREYKNGNTPNPDVLCNKEIKFGKFLEFAEQRGADFVATGHYALLKEENETKKMFISKDKDKDQTYFLWTLDQKKLSKILFPIGDLEKKEVRKLANKNNLHTANKKDSQGLCFIGHVDIKNFLKRYIKTKTGDVLNFKGEKIGTHEGSELYTIGERHGFTLFDNINRSTPYYIISKSLEKNTITVSQEKNEQQKIKEIVLEKINIINKDFDFNKKILVRVRYRGELLNAKLELNQNTSSLIMENKIDNVAKGQSVVFYHNEECLGGGIVKETRSHPKKESMI